MYRTKYRIVHLSFIALLLLLNACSAGKKTSSTPVLPKQQPAAGASKINVDGLLWFARQQMGTPYKYASADPKNGGLDCSGYLFYVFQHFKVTVPRSTKDYMNFGKPVQQHKAQKGNVILFTGSNEKDKVAGHAGIITEIKDGVIHFIHASTSKGVMINKLTDAYYAKRFLKIVDVIN
jgi:murein DD-endopeptidase / murein LD-carboxypeptidase